MEKLEATIREFIVRQILLKNDESILKTDQSLIEAGIIDSLGIQMLKAFLEERYRIVILEDDLYPENFETISAVADLVERVRGRSG